MRVVVIVTHDPSDLYFANQLAKRHNVVGIIVENQRLPFDSTPTWLKAVRLAGNPVQLATRTWDFLAGKFEKSFAVYLRPENSAAFGEEGRTLSVGDDVKVLTTKGVKRINDQEYIDWLKSMNPDIVAVCGASMMKAPIMSVPRFGMLNLHGGLSQYYRGLFTTDWAFYNEEPEYVGATVHFIAPGVDDGDVIYQGRPQLVKEENPHSAYVKVVKLGVDMMSRAIEDIERGDLERSPLQKKGHIYYQRDFTRNARATAWKKLQNGLMTRYLENQEERDRSVRDEMLNEFIPEQNM